jgi:predicted DNA-binding transcriptional regulator AlpA
MQSLSKPNEPCALLTEAQASQLLSLSTRTLQAWRGQGRGPRFVRAGRAVRYRAADLMGWISEQTVSPGSSQMPAGTS